MEQDLNLWGIFAMPLGLTLCFGSALLVWIKAELASKSSVEKRHKP